MFETREPSAHGGADAPQSQIDAIGTEYPAGGTRRVIAGLARVAVRLAGMAGAPFRALLRRARSTYCNKVLAAQLQRLNDQILKDIGIPRGNIDYIVRTTCRR